MCNSKIKLNINNNIFELTTLHTNECLEYYFGKIIVMPTINKEFKNREEVIEFEDKVLALNPSINLPTFKSIINRMIAIKKYKFIMIYLYKYLIIKI